MSKKVQKSSLQLKRERIIRNLAKNEEKARLFREKLISQENIYNGTQTKSTETTIGITLEDGGEK